MSNQWDLRKQVPMTPRGRSKAKSGEIVNVSGMEISNKLKIKSTYSKCKILPVQKSGDTTDSFWDNMNKDHLETVLAVKNNNYKIEKVIN